MPITISSYDLLTYHEEEVFEDAEVRRFVLNHGAEIFELPRFESKRTSLQEKSFVPATLICDSETLEQSMAEPWDLEDPKFKEYFELQKRHKEDFLLEIQSKGITLTSDRERVQKEGQALTNLKHINY
ncbi:uncharacterized protein PRCAT00006199001 [Priceomyces carsonii]|uniref:uncharacterized protein n=1 Tax=Priceomyces carsonii TaxID=28549 RepID=UPI002EDAEB5E|nr:unnamed protein product [Priceomyces carsonii]